MSMQRNLQQELPKLHTPVIEQDTESQPSAVEETGKAALPDFEAREQADELQAVVGIEQALPKPVEEATELQSPAAPDPEESGKAALPELEVEGYEDGEDDLDEDEESTTDPVFTERDEADFPRLESRVLAGTRDAFTALREIRQRKLWRLMRDQEGNPKYKTFDRYVEERWGHSRQWVTHGTNWLCIMETLEKVGVKDVMLTVDAAQGLLPGRLKEAGGLLAVVREAKEDGVTLTRDNLREIVLCRADYSSKSDGPNKPAALTYADYKKDCLVAKKVGRGTWGIVSDVRKQTGDFTENLLKLCTERKQLPVGADLLTVVTGPVLEDIVGRLGTLTQEFTDIEAKKTLLATRKKQIKAMLQGEALAALKKEAKAIQEELEAKGVVLPRKGKPKDKDENEDDQDAEENDEELSEVRENLDSAFQSLQDSLDAPEWPDDDKELQAILTSVENAEKKLGEISAKAKEHLTAVSQIPVTVPSGDT